MAKKRKRSKSVEVNASYVKSRLKEKNISQRSLASFLGIDPPSITRLLAGNRRLLLDEAHKIAEFLQEPLEDVAEAFGIDLKLDTAVGARSKSVKVEGWLDEGLVLRREGLKGKRSVSYPFGESDIHAARFQTAGSEFAGWDGGLVFYRKLKKPGFNPEFIGKACFVRIADTDGLRLRELRRGYGPGKYNLAGLNGRVLEEDARVSETHPVLWLKMT